MKKEQPQQKSSTSGKKIKLTKSNNVEQKNPTQKNMSGIIPNDIEICTLVKQILLCPSLPCNQIFILLCKILVHVQKCSN
jgi:hypothetical protein